jgi:DNA-binding Xre family transcriptional regulator
MSQSNKLSAVGSQIDAAIKRRGISLYRLAKNAKMDYGQLHRMTRGTPSRDNLLKICRALGCSQQEALEIFNETDYRMPTTEELEREEEESAA